mmetsp:Transcript_54210/g.89738  ORF Transcript_54210/g.89738 Transcript_54210/m.89738 type:complete len:224 (+) Transcript_54210:1-672(+)
MEHPMVLNNHNQSISNPTLMMVSSQIMQSIQIPCIPFPIPIPIPMHCKRRRTLLLLVHHSTTQTMNVRTVKYHQTHLRMSHMFTNNNNNNNNHSSLFHIHKCRCMLLHIRLHILTLRMYTTTTTNNCNNNNHPYRCLHLLILIIIMHIHHQTIPVFFRTSWRARSRKHNTYLPNTDSSMHWNCSNVVMHRIPINHVCSNHSDVCTAHFQITTTPCTIINFLSL